MKRNVDVDIYTYYTYFQGSHNHCDIHASADYKHNVFYYMTRGTFLVCLPNAERTPLNRKGIFFVSKF